MKTVFTAFSAFPGVPINPTELLISKWLAIPERRPSGDCECIVLPTEYTGSQEAIDELLKRHKPRLLIMTGVKQSEPTISLERFALNIDDCSTPDAADVVYEGRESRPGSPPALMTSVDLQDLREALVASNYRVDISNHTGTYVCGHAYFTALELIRMQYRDTAVLFVHVPMHPLVSVARSSISAHINTWNRRSTKSGGASRRDLAGQEGDGIRSSFLFSPRRKILASMRACKAQP